jgi:hypothetical protein
MLEFDEKELTLLSALVLGLRVPTEDDLRYPFGLRGAVLGLLDPTGLLGPNVN